MVPLSSLDIPVWHIAAAFLPLDDAMRALLGTFRSNSDPAPLHQTARLVLLPCPRSVSNRMSLSALLVVASAFPSSLVAGFSCWPHLLSIHPPTAALLGPCFQREVRRCPVAPLALSGLGTGVPSVVAVSAASSSTRLMPRQREAHCLHRRQSPPGLLASCGERVAPSTHQIP